MKHIEVNQKDLNKINTIISNYQKIHDELNIIESKLKTLNYERTVLSNKLDGIRQDDKMLSDYFISKYGKGKLDINRQIYIIE